MVMNEKKLIIGLGNPGDRYKFSRHNIGFLILDKYLQEKNLKFKKSSKFNAEICEDGNNIFLKPQTFMNKSGDSVAKVVNYYKCDLKNIYLIHDDLDLALGKTKKQFGVGAAGHHGVESVLLAVGSKKIWRIRIGIGKPQGVTETEDWVLQEFPKEDIENILDNTNLDKLLKED